MILPAADLFAPGTASVLVLFGARVGGLVLVAPVFSANTVPAMVRTGVLVLLTILLQPVAMSHLTAVPQITPSAFLGETLVGFAIGLGAALFVGAAEAAGDLMAIQIGLSGAALMDPLSNTSAPVLATFTQLFAVALLLSLDAHLLMLDSLAASTRAIPVGSAMDLQAGAGAMVSLGTSLFAMGIRFAAPVVAAVMIANASLAILGRAAPQLNILSVAFPIQIAVGLFAFAAALPLIAVFFTTWAMPYDGMLTHVFNALAGRGGR